MEYSDNFKRKAAGVMISNRAIERLGRAMETYNHTEVRYLLEDSLDLVEFNEPVRDTGDAAIHNSKLNMHKQTQEVYSEFSNMYETYLDENSTN